MLISKLQVNSRKLTFKDSVGTDKISSQLSMKICGDVWSVGMVDGEIVYRGDETINRWSVYACLRLVFFLS